MNKHSSQLLQLTRRRAGFTLHQLLDEIQLLTVAFPDVRDAFDADELPIAFILKRDAHRSRAGCRLDSGLGGKEAEGQ